MPQKKGTTAGDRASGYIREVAEVDQASDYLEGMTDRTVDYVRGTVSDTRDKVAELGDRKIASWTRELRIEALGMPAVLPPPEEEKDVKTAIGAARAKKARREML